MDIVSHGLWGAISFGRKNKKSFWMAFLYGMMPDLLSFGIFFAATLLGLSRKVTFTHGPPDSSAIPEYVHVLYNITHSFVTFALLFVLLWVIFRRPVWEFTAWGLHILMDIGTHSTAFFPTPFLWPFVAYRVNGIPWSHALIMIPDIILLALLYGYFFLLRPYLRNERKNKK